MESSEDNAQKLYVNVDDPLSTISHSLRSAYAQQDDAKLLELLKSYAIESWYGLSPRELSQIVQRLAQSNSLSPELALFLKGLSAFGETPQPSFHDELFRLKQQRSPIAALLVVVDTFALRIKGHVREAYESTPHVHSLIEQTLAFDFHGGTQLMLLAQSGNNALLVGEYKEATQHFVAAQAQPVSATLPFLTRDAYVKHALIHAAFGSRQEAQRLLSSARRIARSSSWVEGHLDAVEHIVNSFLSLDDASKALGILDVPLDQVGEMWPFYVIAVHRSLLINPENRTLRTHFNHLRSIPFASVERQGLNASVFPLSDALVALTKGAPALAQQALVNADPKLLNTALIRCLIELASGQPLPAKIRAYQLREETQPFTHLNILRLSIIASAHLALEEHEECILTIRIAQNLAYDVSSRIEHFFSPAVHTFIAQDGGIENFATSNTTFPATAFLGAPETRTEALSEREIEIVRALSQGGTRVQVSARLFVSENTLKSHLSRIYKKLGVNNRDSAILVAEQRGLI